jgi:hypothetical protein
VSDEGGRPSEHCRPDPVGADTNAPRSEAQTPRPHAHRHTGTTGPGAFTRHSPRSPPFACRASPGARVRGLRRWFRTAIERAAGLGDPSGRSAAMDGFPSRQAQPALCLSTTGRNRRAARRAEGIATIASASLGDHEAIESDELQHRTADVDGLPHL